MNYYEELGVNCEARTEEIRQAYRTLARLLHPDGQTDERMKSMADRQMQRLNAILEILTDQERRREYDDVLRATERVLALPPYSPEPEVSRRDEWVRAATRYWYWVLVGTAVAGAVAMWWATPPARSVTVALPERPQTAAVEGSVPPLKSKGSMKAPPAERPSRQPGPLRANSDSVNPRQGGVSTHTAGGGRVSKVNPVEQTVSGGNTNGNIRPTVSAAAEALPVGEKQDSAPRLQEWRFAGTWLYVPDLAEASGQGGYPAEYVELLLREENGELVGKYRAKYKVPDKALSPDVELLIRASVPLGKQVRAEWSNATGAKGVVELTLRRPGLIGVAWWTTEFGRQPQLTSGGATLVGQQTR